MEEIRVTFPGESSPGRHRTGPRAGPGAACRSRQAPRLRLAPPRNPATGWATLADMAVLRYLLAVLLVIGTAACSPTGGTRPPTADVPRPETAEQIVARLAAKIPTVTPGIVYTAQTDPNQLLGTPHSYTSKAAFTDSRINPAEANDTEIGSIELGGSVEVFANDADARARKDYLDQIVKDLPIDVSEYSYLHGPILLRVSRRLTPTQATEYQAALDAT
jgi:hypothetical protein